MNLLPDHAQALFQGAIAVTQDAQGRFFPQRLTARQFAHYASTEMYRLRSVCCAGMKIALRTDSPTVTLELEIEPGCREYFSLSFQVNGCFLPGLFNLRQPDAAEKWTFRLNPTGQPADIVIWLSPFRPAYFRAICIEDGCSFAPLPAPERKLLCCGDSITQGMTSFHPLNAYASVLARLLDADLLNQAIGGHYVDAPSFDSDLPYRPDLITVAFGTNDWTRKTSREQVAANIADYLRQIRNFAPQAPVFWITPLWRNNSHEQRPGGTLQEFSQTIAEAAGAGGATVIDGMQMLPHDEEYFFDGLHPNDLGGVLYGANLCREIRNRWCASAAPSPLSPPRGVSPDC